MDGRHGRMMGPTQLSLEPGMISPLHVCLSTVKCELEDAVY